MKLLGERNWYLPTWLEWLPHFDHGELEIVDEPEPETAPAEGRARKPKRRPDAVARSPGSCSIAVLALGLAYLGARLQQQRGLRPRRGEGRPADPASVPLRHGEGQLRGRLRDARRAGEPGRPAVAADRAAGHPHQGALGPSGRAGLPARGRAGHHEHDSSRRRAGSPRTTTSSSSATAASTARSGSTAPRSCRR